MEKFVGPLCITRLGKSRVSIMAVPDTATNDGR
jgi:hypothetical protein